MSRFFYIKSNVKTTTDYRQANNSSVLGRDLKQPNFKLMNSSHFDYDFNQQRSSSFMAKDYIRREKNQNDPDNANTSVEMNFLTNYKNLKKFYDSPPVFSSYNLQSKIIAANLSYETNSSYDLSYRSNNSSNMQSLLSSFYASEYPRSEASKRKQKTSFRAPRTSFLENFERTQMLIRNSFMLNTNSNIGGANSYSVPNIHNTKINANTKPSYDSGFNIGIQPKTSFENSLSSSGIGIENEIQYDDYKLNVPYDEFQVTHFREKTFNYTNLAKANAKSCLEGNNDQNEMPSFDTTELKKRRGRNEKMSIVDSIIAKYQPDNSGDFAQTKSSDHLSTNSTDFKKFRLDSDQDSNKLAFNFQKQQQQQQLQSHQIRMQLQNQDEEIDQLSELSLGSQESIATSASTTPSSSPKSNKQEFSLLEMGQLNSASEIMLDTKVPKQQQQQQVEKSDEAVIYSNGNKKLINLSEKLEKFRSTINIVRKTEEDFGDLLKSEDDDDETSSMKPSNSSELKELPTEVSEPSLIFNDQLQDEMQGNKKDGNNADNDKANNENNHDANS